MICIRNVHESVRFYLNSQPSLFVTGGLELGSLEACLVTEELAYACSGIGTAVLANDLGVSELKCYS